jgi:olefin beta-lactone synthetase
MRSDANITRYLQAAVQRRPERPALAMGLGHDRLTYGELWDKVDRASTGLARAGLRPGDRVICMVPMSLDLYVILLGVLKAGGVAVFVDPWVGLRQVAAFAAFAEPRAYVGAFKSHLLRFLQPALRRLPLTITCGTRVGGIPARLTLKELLSKPGNGVIRERGPSDPALITFTSGSSGTPKGVNRTHGFLRAQHEALRHEFPYADSDVDMSMFPVFALNNLALGISSVIPAIDFQRVAEMNAEAVLDSIEYHRVTTCTGSPPFFERLVEYVESSPSRRPALRRILTGGAPVSNEQLLRFKNALPQTEILVVYGSTEAEPVAHVDCEQRLSGRSATRPAHPGFCLGRVAPCVRSRIIRIVKGPVVLPETGWAGIELEDGEIGELVVAGDHVGRDYYRNAKAVAENKIVDPHGTVWHRMGDTVYRDTNGMLWLAGRVHSTIWRAGHPVHAQLLEQAAARDKIKQVAAVGLPDAALGERLVLAVHGGETNPVRLKQRLTGEGFPVDEVVVSTTPLPVDPRHNSKIDYGRLRDQLTRRGGR